MGVVKPTSWTTTRAHVDAVQPAAGHIGPLLTITARVGVVDVEELLLDVVEELLRTVVEELGLDGAGLLGCCGRGLVGAGAAGVGGGGVAVRVRVAGLSVAVAAVGATSSSGVDVTAWGALVGTGSAATLVGGAVVVSGRPDDVADPAMPRTVLGPATASEVESLGRPRNSPAAAASSSASPPASTGTTARR